MVVAVPSDHADAAIELLNTEGENAWKIGTIENATANEEQVELRGLEA